MGVVDRRARRAPRAGWAVLTAVAVLAPMLLAGSADAQTPPSRTFTVNSNADQQDASIGDGNCAATSGGCTLRAAVQEANASASVTDTIVLASGVTYGLTRQGADDTAANGDLDVVGPLTIQGNGAAVSAAALDPDQSGPLLGDRILHLLPNANLVLERVTLTGGNVSGAGGAIYAQVATLTLRGSYVIGNAASGNGGAILFDGSGTPKVGPPGVIEGTAFIANRAVKGGAISTLSPLTISSSTLRGNAVNAATSGAAVLTGASVTTTFRSSVVAANTITGGGTAHQCDTFAPGAATSTGYNLSTDATCGLTQSTDKANVAADTLGVDPYGPLLAGSPAVDAGGPTCPATDLAAVARPRYGLCDIGAFEATSLVVTSTNDFDDAAVGSGGCADSSGACTLRAAIRETNAAAGADTIVLGGAARTPTTYGLTLRTGTAGPTTNLEDAGATGDLDVTGPLTIDGNGATISAAALDPDGIGPNAGDRVLHGTSSSSITLVRTSLTGGSIVGNNQGGGALLAQGGLTLDRVMLVTNRSEGGGGLSFTGTPAATITQAVIVNNQAPKGGGILTTTNLNVKWSTIDENSVTTLNKGAGILTNAATATVTLEGTIVTNNHGAHDCDQFGTVTSLGRNIDATGSCQTTAAGDQHTTDVRLLWGIQPQPGSKAIDAAGTGCPATDGAGTTRPQLAACDVGAIEMDDRATRYLYDAATRNVATPTDNDKVNKMIAKAVASYARGDHATGDAAVDALAGVGFPAIPDTVRTVNPDPFPANVPTKWHGEFPFGQLMRLFIQDKPTAWVTNPNDAHRQKVLYWISQYTNLCRFDTEWNVQPNVAATVWGVDGSENHHINKSTNCTLGLYLRATEPVGPNNPVPPAATGTWQTWAAKMKDWVKATARVGISIEQSPGYGPITASAIFQLLGFPGDPALSTAADSLAKLTMHDLAHQFNATAASSGASGARMYQPDPEGPDASLTNSQGWYYEFPELNWAVKWSYLFGWHSKGDMDEPMLLSVALSGWKPLAITTDLAKMTGKSIEYDVTRPQRLGAGNTDHPYHVQHVTTNDAYTMGASTYGFRDEANNEVQPNFAGTENIWYSVTPNTDVRDRLIVSGVGETKPSSYDGYADYAAINGAEYRDVIIAGRDHRTEDWSRAWGNSRGVRVFFGGALRANLWDDPASPWWFTTAGNTFIAVRTSAASTQLKLDDNGKVRELRQIDDDGPVPGQCNTEHGQNAAACCPDVPVNSVDCWAPLIVQVGRLGTTNGAGVYTSFTNFKTAVKATIGNNQDRFQYVGETLTYTSLKGDTFQMSRQEDTASLPKVLRSDVANATLSDVDLTPDWAYKSDYLTMPWGNPVATLTGPSGASVQLSFA